MSGAGAGPRVGGLRIAVAGASGRMGRMLIEAVLGAPDLTLHGALDAVSYTHLTLPTNREV